MSRDLSRPDIKNDAEGFAKAAALTQAAADLLWDAARYVRATADEVTDPSVAKYPSRRAVNYNLCRFVDHVEDQVKALDVLLLACDPVRAKAVAEALEIVDKLAETIRNAKPPEDDISEIDQ